MTSYEPGWPTVIAYLALVAALTVLLGRTFIRTGRAPVWLYAAMALTSAAGMAPVLVS